MKAGFCLYKKKKEKQNKKHIQFRNQKYLFYSFNLNRLEGEEEEMGLTVVNCGLLLLLLLFFLVLQERFKI
jgi:hypothetical protein